MKALLINCTSKESPERDSATQVVRMLEVSFEAIGVGSDVALPSDIWSPVDLELTGHRPTGAAGLPSNWLTQSLLQSRILVLVSSPASTLCVRLASRTLTRLATVVDRPRGAGVKVAAPLSVNGGRRSDSGLLNLCCRLMDVGYVVPEQAWREWPNHSVARRTVRAANDLVAVAGALGAAVTGETISSYPPFSGPHRDRAGQNRRDLPIR